MKSMKVGLFVLLMSLVGGIGSFGQEEHHRHPLSEGWTTFSSERQYPGYKWMELNRSAHFLVTEILGIQPGENIVLYADTATDPRVVQATSAAIYNIGAHPINVWYETRGDIDLPPPAPVEAAVLSADMAIEFAVAYLVHSDMWSKAREKGIPMKCLTGMNVDMMIRTINPDNYHKMTEFGRAYRQVLDTAQQEYRITSPAGTDLTFKAYSPEQRATRAARRAQTSSEGRRRGGMLGGQGGFSGDASTATGTLVFDGAVWPPSEVADLEEPIVMKIKDGKVTEIISDHEEAEILKNWFAHFKDERVYEFVHISTGFHPGVKKITGDIVEDERVFGAVEIGIGMASPELPAHTDGVILNPSVYVDGVAVEQDGVFVEPTLKRLAEELGMQLWIDSPITSSSNNEGSN